MKNTNPFITTENSSVPPPPQERRISANEIRQWSDPRYESKIIGYAYKDINIFQINNREKKKKDKILISEIAERNNRNNHRNLFLMQQQKQRWQIQNHLKFIQTKLSTDNDYYVLCPVKKCCKKFKNKDELERHICMHAQPPKEEESTERQPSISGKLKIQNQQSSSSLINTIQDSKKNNFENKVIDILINLNKDIVRSNVYSSETKEYDKDNSTQICALLSSLNKKKKDNKESISQETNYSVGHNHRNGNNDKGRIFPILNNTNEILTKEQISSCINHYIKKITNKSNGIYKNTYICTLCPSRVFSRYGHAIVHVRAHYNVKPYVCSWKNCCRKFGQKSHFNRHIKIHKGLRSHICSECKHSFFQRSNLISHMKIHQHNRKIWYCNFSKCTKKFTFEKSLQRHYNQIH